MSLPGPAEQTRIADIEVLRCAAIVMVLFAHAPFNLLYWNTLWLTISFGYWSGDAGVDLFFVISGFVIGRSVLPRLRAAPNGGAYLAATLTFLLRRFWRLQPAAWVWLVIPLALAATFNASGAFRRLLPDFSSALTGLLAINNFRTAAPFGDPDVFNREGISFPYWSLSLEEQFYLLLPLLYWVFRRRLTLVLVCAVVYQFLAPIAPVCALTRPGALAAGVLLAEWSGRAAYRLAEPRFLARSGLCRGAFVVFLLFVAGAAESTLILPVNAGKFGIVAAVSAILVYAASFDAGYILRPGRLKRVCVWVGERSYSLYLTHIPSYALAREILFRLRPPTLWHSFLDGALHVGLALVFTFGATELTRRFVEEPCRRYGRGLTIA